jgi:hypothetical protein
MGPWMEQGIYRKGQVLGDPTSYKHKKSSVFVPEVHYMGRISGGTLSTVCSLPGSSPTVLMCAAEYPALSSCLFASGCHRCPGPKWQYESLN